ncbi:MAG: MiaB/RimO family radical SAM methylthiotransferase, partial [Planctomycetota bacterium]
AGCAVSADGCEEVVARTGADLALTQEEKLDPELPALAALLGRASPPPRTGGITRFDAHCRAFVKVQDGCDAFCAYCVIPRLRGAPRSRPLREIRREAEDLAESGHRELVVSGVHLGLYGRDLDGRPGLADVLRTVLDAAPRARVRLSSLDPTELDDEILGLAATEPRVCPHLHLPLQSGDAGVLRAMRRRYDPPGFLRAVDRARARLDRPGITTDVMTGFPGESDAAFRNTVEVCRRAGFSRMHVFPFSPREGTDAAGMADRVPTGVARDRAAKLVELGAESAAEFARGCVGNEEEVLVEEAPPDGSLAGYSARYVRTYFRTEPDVPRRALCRVRIDRCEGGEIFGLAT